MSAPATTSKIAHNPGKMGVTTAASGKELEADVARKMKLWGVIEAFNDGRMPDNTQIDKVLEHAINTSPVDLKKLSPEGRVLIEDFRDVMETMRMMVVEKNADEIFQNAIYDSYHADPSRAKQSGVLPVGKDEAKQDLDQASAHLRTLVTLFITNSEARKIISDLGTIGRDVFASGAVKVAEKVRPDQEALDKADQEAPSKEWIGPDGKRLGPNDTPELQVKGPKGSEIRYNPKDDPRDAKVTDHQGNTRSAGSAYDEAQQKKQEAQQQKEQNKGEAKEQLKSHAQDLDNSRDPNASLSQQKDQVLGRADDKRSEAESEANRQSNRSDMPNDQGEAKDQARGKAEQLKNRIPEEHRERVDNAVQETKEFVHDVFPEERREQFIYRLKKVVVECQQHKDYQEAMEWLLTFFENYKQHAQHVAGKGAESADALKSEPKVAGATVQFRTLLERFANGKSMDGMQKALDQIYTDAQNDSELRNWWSSLNDYVHRILLEPGYILEDDSTREAEKLQKSGKHFFEDKYRSHWENLADSIQLFFTAMHHDPLNRRLGDDVKRFTKDLLFNSEGNLTFKPHLWDDIRHVLLPTFIKQIGYVPIPRAEFSNNDIDLVIENLVLSGPNLFPNVVGIESHNSFKFSPYDQLNKSMDTHHHKFRLSMSQIQADIRDVRFSFRRKTGWPKLKDHGIADVVLAGKGMSIDVELESVEKKRDSLIRVNSVHTTIDTLTFAIRDSKHDLLYKFVKSFATGTIKKAIQAAVDNAIRTAVGHLDDQLVQVRNTVDDAKKSDETTRTQALKDLYSKKADTAQKKQAEAKETPGTFRIVANRDSVLNPDMGGGKGAMTNKMWKTEDLAHSGKSWHSPAFDLLDKKHPGVTGESHPAAKDGAGAGNSLSSKAQQGAREVDQLKATHGQSEAERISGQKA